MITCVWNLANVQEAKNPPFSEIQTALSRLGIMLDFSYEKGIVSLTLAFPEISGENEKSSSDHEELFSASSKTGSVESASSQDNKVHMEDVQSHQNPENAALPQKRGRPSSVPSNDLTFEKVRYMRSMGVTVSEIAREIGVSKRTFYRRWRNIADSMLEGTPFSQW